MFCTSGCITNSNLRRTVPSAVNKSLGGLFAATLVLALTSLPSSAQAIFTSLHSFDQTDGQNPQYVHLVQGTDGQLYGTASGGGNNGDGTAYKITTSGTFTLLWSFCSLTNCADGAFPYGGLVLAPNGNFYGTASEYGSDTQGACDTGIYGCGTIFEITPAGVLTVLHTFTGPDGFEPYVNLTLGTDGNLYGTTVYGGTYTNNPGCSGIGCGTVFKITPSGTFTSLYSFQGPQGADGSNPIGRLFQGSDGNFYGTTLGDTVFKITPGGKLTTLYSFCSLANCADGNYPYGGVIRTSNGTIYGTTAGGGANNYGTVYKLVGKKLTVLYSFCSLANCADGNYPYGGLIQATDGNFYGTTNFGGPSSGTVFEITPSGNLTTLYTFCSQPQCPDGSGPYGDLLQATDGNFYGTTDEGGESNYWGTIFRVSTGLGPFVQSVTSIGRVGTKITILGTSLTGTTGVSFNGTAASFKVGAGGTSLTTTIPAGATTGNISVVTPGGTLSSNVSFRLTPQVKSFNPTSGAAGTSVTITGVSLTQATKVTFGGVAASFTVNSDTQITATVPTAAVTGKIAVTTAGGTASSSTNFTVTP